MTSNAGDKRRRELAIIHVAKKQLGLDDATYRDVLWTVGRVTSSADLDDYGRGRVIKHLQSRGFKKIKGKSDKRYTGHPGGVGVDREKLVGKVEALLADMSLPWSYADGVANRMYGIEKVRFCSPTQLRSLIAALTKRQKKEREGNQ